MHHPILKGKWGDIIKYNFSQIDIDDIISKYNSGLSLKKIGLAYNCSSKPIKRIILDNGGTIRDNSEAIHKYKVNEGYFDQIDTPSKAYVLGFLYADGCNYINHKTWVFHWQIILKSDDVDLLEDIKNEVGYTGIVDTKERFAHGRLREYSRLTVCNRHMCEKLAELGVTPNKTYSLSFPTWMHSALLPHFVRGFFDGDGCIDKMGHASFAGSESFVRQLSEIIAHTCNLKCNLYQCKQSNCTYQCHMSGKLNSKIFLDWIYKDADIKMERKYQRYLDAYYKTQT